MSTESYFAQRMRDLRNLQGISQRVLADKVTERVQYAVDPTAVTRMEKRARLIRLGEAVAIAEVLGVPLSEMLPPNAGGEGRQIMQLPEALVERMRSLHEITGAVIRLADSGEATS